MTYATQQDMIDRFGQQQMIELTDRSRTGNIDVTVLGQALADADNEIDGYLSSVCALPLISVPPRLSKLASDIARYELYGTRVTEQVRARYTDAISYLKLVVSGNASLGLDPLHQVVAEVGGVGMNTKAPVFSGNSLSDY